MSENIDISKELKRTSTMWIAFIYFSFALIGVVIATVSLIGYMSSGSAQPQLMGKRPANCPLFIVK